MMTGKEYIDSLKALRQAVYFRGERIENPTEHPALLPSLRSVAASYIFAEMPEHRELMTADSSLIAARINRFTHIHQGTDDLEKKVKMQRLLGQSTGACFQRCVGMDAANAVYSTAYDIDQACGTQYFERFIQYWREVQRADLTVGGAMTDPKGNRSKAPGAQKDKDLYLRVVERRADGIIVCGAKAHQTGIVNSHEVLVMPTVSMRAGEEDYAICFAVPTDVRGLKMILGRQSSDLRRLEPNAGMDMGNVVYGGHEALAIFDHVFVPNERIFLDGETAFCGRLVERFASYHRQSYGGCKVGVGDVLIGAAAMAAEANGCEKASHVNDKLVEMTHLNETLYCCGIACSTQGHCTAAGNYEADALLANVCKLNVTRFPYEIARLAEDIAGGLMVTMPGEADYENEEIRPYLQKYLQGAEDVAVETRMRILRLIENLTLGTGAVGYRTESLHGAGSPQAQRIMIRRLAEFERKKAYACALAGVKPADAAKENDTAGA